MAGIGYPAAPILQFADDPARLSNLLLSVGCHKHNDVVYTRPVTNTNNGFGLYRKRKSRNRLDSR